MTRRSWSIAAITIAVLILASYTHEIISRVPAYGWLHSHRPFYVAESIDKIGGAAVCLLAVWLMYRTGIRGISRELGLKGRGITWKCKGPIERNHECVDVTGRKRKPRILIEVELRRTTPLGNVAKVWKWIDEGKLRKDIVLVQAFSKYYFRDPVNSSRQKNAEFLGKQMHKAVGARYISLSFEYRPGKSAKKGGGRRKFQAQQLAKRVLKKLKDMRQL